MSVTGISLEDNNALSANDVDKSADKDIDTSAGKQPEALIPLLSQSTSSELETDCENEEKSSRRDPDTYKSQLTKVEIETKEQLSIQQSDLPKVQICQPDTSECNNNSKEQIVFTDPVSTSNEVVKEITPTTKSVDPSAKVDVMRLGCSKEALRPSKEHPRELFLAPKHQKPQTVKSSPVMVVAPTQSVKKTNSGSMGYKTLKVPPKTWNPSITRSSYLHSKNQASSLDSSVNAPNVNPSKSAEKAPKFFKMRNMPRYLGNPASGVKPMYQVASNSKVPNPTPTAKNKPIVMKIDPKTLSPIVSSNTSPGPQNKAFYNTSQTTTESPTTTSNVLNRKDQGKTGRFSCQTFPSSTGTSSTMISSTNVSHSSNFSLNSATLNMLASNPSFLPNPTNFLYGNFPNFSPPLLGAGSSMVPGLGAYHAMPPSINMLFPHHRSSFPAHPPAVQRIPPSKNNGTSSVGHKLHHSTPNSNTSSLSKSPLQSNAVAKSNVLNPKNGIDSKQIKKSTDPTSFKPKNSQNDEVFPADLQTNSSELNIINNNNNDLTPQSAIKNNEPINKWSIEKDKEEEKELGVMREGNTLDTRCPTEQSRIGTEVLKYDQDQDHRKDKPEMLSSNTCIKSPLVTECTTLVKEEKSPPAFCTPVSLKMDKTCYSGQKPDMKSKDTIAPLQSKT